MNSKGMKAPVLAALLAAGGAVLAPRPAASQSSAAPLAKAFVTPDDAVSALRSALKTDDRTALRDIFGPDFSDLLTGDKAQDAANARRFAKVLGKGAVIVAEGDAKAVVEIGPDRWPFPIPIVKDGTAWRFDTAAGKQEIVDRHVGKDELHAIGVCEAYGPAQKQYADAGRGSAGTTLYAFKFKSAPGKRDGLYWETEKGKAPSPFGARIADADVAGTAPKPFHGYLFRILTRQGAAAPGGALDYAKNGAFSGGYALVAYPESWGRSGIMTFIVAQDGRVYQRDLGEKTAERASVMTEYDPGEEWAAVKDRGVIEK